MNATTIGADIPGIGADVPAFVTVADAATCTTTDTLSTLGTTLDGLPSQTEILRRRSVAGPNAVNIHRVSALAVLLRQLRSALLGLLGLLAIAATLSYFVGERTDAIVIGIILAISVGLGFGNEYPAERAGAALHDQVHHRTVVIRAGQAEDLDVVEQHCVRARRGRSGEPSTGDRLQVGLRRFSMMLAWVAGILTVFIFAINLLLHRPVIDAVLLSLAIAVGITPQLLPRSSA